ncbi:MAG TPA: hypothetical protein VM096_00045, partial [Vicinamibacterales bacterium]|nr:hypothetical protein [Vicinamibacterales bacterium]
KIATYARYVVTAIWVFAGIGLAGATAAEVRRAWSVVPTPPEVIQDVTVRNVKDDEGRSASFRILLFSDEFRWRINSFDSVEAGGKRPDFTPEMKAVLNSAVEIIAVGASSEEIPPGISFPEGRAKEERRAGRRADQIAVWVREVLNRPIPVRKLNVGHHTPTGTDETSDQRRVVIILVLNQDEDTNIDQSLRSAMTSQAVRAPIFESLLTKYSLGGGDHFEWVP